MPDEQDNETSAKNEWPGLVEFKDGEMSTFPDDITVLDGSDELNTEDPEVDRTGNNSDYDIANNGMLTEIMSDDPIKWLLDHGWKRGPHRDSYEDPVLGAYFDIRNAVDMQLSRKAKTKK